MEADGDDEDVDIEGEEEPEPASSLDTAGSTHSEDHLPPTLVLPLLLIRF
jgi:hypothetical protein